MIMKLPFFILYRVLDCFFRKCGLNMFNGNLFVKPNYIYFKKVTYMYQHFGDMRNMYNSILEFYLGLSYRLKK